MQAARLKKEGLLAGGRGKRERKSIVPGEKGKNKVDSYGKRRRALRKMPLFKIDRVLWRKEQGWDSGFP